MVASIFEFVLTVIVPGLTVLSAAVGAYQLGRRTRLGNLFVLFAAISGVVVGCALNLGAETFLALLQPTDVPLLVRVVLATGVISFLVVPLALTVGGGVHQQRARFKATRRRPRVRVDRSRSADGESSCPPVANGRTGLLDTDLGDEPIELPSPQSTTTETDGARRQ